MRNIDYWFAQILQQKENTAELDVLNSTSKVAVWRLFAYVVAVVCWSLDTLFSIHKTEIDTLIAKEKAHGKQWYRSKALAFQYGQDVMPETDKYDNTNLTPAQVALKKIIKQAAVTAVDGRLRIKTVTENASGDFLQLTTQQLDAFEEYINKIKDAGERVKCESLPPDDMRLSIDIFYNPLILNADGGRIDGNSATPVPDTIKDFLKKLPFNGEYANSRLHTALNNTPGVALAVINYAQVKYGLFPYITVDERYIPDAGYLALNQLNINYREYAV